MTLNNIRWWGSSFGALGSVEYPLIAITPRSILNKNIYQQIICLQNIYTNIKSPRSWFAIKQNNLT